MKYKIILLGILLLLASFGFAITITTCQGLQEINQNLNGTYILGNDIDCSQTNTWNSGAGFQPIGSWGPWFTGVFDGAGYTISGLYINRPTTDDVGLFGCTYSTAIIQNINLQDANIIGRSNVGSIIGTATGSVSNLSASFDSIQGTGSYIGGLVGRIYGISPSTLYEFNNLTININSIQGGSYVGGIIGGMANWSTGGVEFTNLSSTITNGLYSTSSYNGGLIGGALSQKTNLRNSTADINYIYNKGSGSYIGGLIGKTDGNIYDSNSTITLIGLERTAHYDSVTGGLAGQANHIENSWSQTNINATLGPTFSGAYIGGLAGIANTINNSYSKGNYITANKSNGYYIGGLVGKLSAGSITNSYSSIQTIDAGTNYYIGGLVGEGSNITNSFSITDVTGGSNSGPFCGYTCNSITNSYYLNGNDVTLYGGNNISSEGSTYFKGTSIVEPFTNWNFYNSQSKPTGDWFVWTNDYPHLSLSPIINYYTNGTFISKKMNLSAPKKFTTMDLNMNKPTDTNIEIQIRTATSEIGLDIAPWLGPDGTNETNYLVDGETINSIHDKNSWVQYKATLTTTNTSVTPTLYDINIHTIAIGEVIYAKLNSGFTWLSFNQSNDLNGCTVNWYYSLNNSPYAWESTSETLTGSDNLWIKAIINGTIDSNNLRIENISINYAE
ncbi:MAG: GLUG motif-containing protein [Candidatus ainarchaeum sp.]|nr:GLUG motif-containing protein [Candidatus ainarchaeum sp.]